MSIITIKSRKTRHIAGLKIKLRCIGIYNYITIFIRNLNQIPLSNWLFADMTSAEIVFSFSFLLVKAASSYSPWSGLYFFFWAYFLLLLVVLGLLRPVVEQPKLFSLCSW